MNRSFRNIVALCVTLLVCTLVMQASPLIVNGTFTPSPAYNPKLTSGYYPGAAKNIFVSPWWFTGASTYANGLSTFNGSGVAGDQAAVWRYVPMNGAPYNAFLQGLSYISQTVSSLIQGDEYKLVFYLSARPGYLVDPVDVIVGGTRNTTTGFVTGGTQLGSTIAVNYVAAGNKPGWTMYTENFTATSTSELITFKSTKPGGALTCGASGIAVCDYDVGLDDVSLTQTAPEPAMALLLPLGLLFVNGLRKRFLA